MPGWLETVSLVAASALLLVWLAGVRYIPHNKVGVVEKLWSLSGAGSFAEVVEGEVGRL